MTQHRDGGPAFPRITYWHGEPGMSLRDWFAGQALPGIINGFVNDYGHLPETKGQWESVARKSDICRRPHDVQEGGEMIQNLYSTSRPGNREGPFIRRNGLRTGKRLAHSPLEDCTSEEADYHESLTLQRAWPGLGSQERSQDDLKLELRVRMEHRRRNRVRDRRRYCRAKGVQGLL